MIKFLLKTDIFSITIFFFFNYTESGFKNVQFHVRGNLSNYTKEKIFKIKETVAAIVGCPEEEICVSGFLHSSSFIVVFSVKEIYLRNILAMKQQDKDKLCSLNIDYFTIECLTGKSSNIAIFSDV